MSPPGLTPPTWAARQLGGYPGQTGRGADLTAKAARDPQATSAKLKSRSAAVRAMLSVGSTAAQRQAPTIPSGTRGTTEGPLDMTSELAEIEDKIKRTKLSKEAREKAEHELKKLRQMSPMSAEATALRNYLDWLLSIPWNKKTKVKKDLKLAQEILDNDHFGLEKVKERIVEYLAVQQRANKLTGPILCLVGPPGVGKTSLGKSIARATGRDFVPVSLGGVRDEAEIRGHRRTYIGSMPRKVIQGMKKAKSPNPLLLLAEVDKLGADWCC